MAKVSGVYPSLSRGVSQQPPEARLDGQHGEQVNMWTDPVHGLSRRRGTLLQYCYTDNVFGPSYHSLNEAEKKELREFYASYRTVAWTTQGAEFMVHYPSKPTPVWMRSIFQGGIGGIKITRKIQNAGPMQPGGEVADPDTGTYDTPEYNATWAKVHQGFSSAVQVGRYLLLYPNNTQFTFPADVDAWDRPINRYSAVQVLHGIPNRTYVLSYGVDGVTYTASYTTPSSVYSGTLNTSDIPYNDPEYTKKVNDRVNAYNSAVTAWITQAANETRPAFIVEKLRQQVNVTLANIGEASLVLDSTLCLPAANGRINGVSITDSGDDSTVRCVFQTVESAKDLSSVHIIGKIVQVRPSQDAAPYYVMAVARDSTTTFGWARVRWQECARTLQTSPAMPFVVLAYKTGAKTGASTSITHLRSLIADPTVDLPPFAVRQVGDQETNPTPHFANRQVDHMVMFQDRLCLISGSVINMSETGNYFNFWRTQTTTVPDKDPVEIYALGSEDDVIRHSVYFDRSIVFFGDKQQYSIDGRIPVTPASTVVIQSGAIEDAADAPPVAGGNLVFFGKRREGSAEIFQMEIGNVQDTSNYSGLGLQLSDYIPGKPVQLLHVSSPGLLFVRTDASPHSVYVFRYIDQGGQRLLDSWFRFDYHPAFGIIHSMFYHDDAIYYRVAREAWKDENGQVWTGGRGDYGFDVLERQSLLPQVPGLPYLDSMRKADTVWTGGAYGNDWHANRYPFLATAFTRDKIAGYSVGDPPPPKSPLWLHGTTPNPATAAEWATAFADLPNRDMNYCVTGIPFDSYVELTSPMRRDSNGQPIMQGRLTVNKLEVNYKDAGGFTATVKSRYGIVDQHNSFDWVATNTAYGTTTALRFNGRELGQAANMVGVIPVTTGSTAVFVGRETREYVCRISARSWMPLSITRVAWTGQWFLNHQFV